MRYIRVYIDGTLKFEWNYTPELANTVNNLQFPGNVRISIDPDGGSESQSTRSFTEILDGLFRNPRVGRFGLRRRPIGNANRPIVTRYPENFVDFNSMYPTRMTNVRNLIWDVTPDPNPNAVPGQVTTVDDILDQIIPFVGNHFMHRPTYSEQRHYPRCINVFVGPCIYSNLALRCPDFEITFPPASLHIPPFILNRSTSPHFIRVLYASFPGDWKTLCLSSHGKTLICAKNPSTGLIGAVVRNVAVVA